VLSERLVLDWGAKIGAVARSEFAPAFFFTHVIASLDEFSSRETVCFTAIAARRFAERYCCCYQTAEVVAQAMYDIYEKGGGKEDARRLLGFAKWVYEALRRPVPRAESATLLDVLRCLA
jgi:hypothetical protein